MAGPPQIGATIDENVAAGLSPTAKFQVGISNVDTAGIDVEKNWYLPYIVDPELSWLEYSCRIEAILDAGIVLHKILPQSDDPIDTLANGWVDDAAFAKIRDTENLKSKGDYEDFIQRMASSNYRFRVHGYGVRACYPVPVPGLRTVAGIEAVPDKRQWSRGNEIIANGGGIPIYFNRWELWYMLATPPKKNQPAPRNLAQQIGSDETLPPGIAVPLSQPDYNAQTSGPLQNPVRG